ncbi:MAG: PEP-CTERM sorting domain-containing protein [Bryobacteraceae bacterium]
MSFQNIISNRVLITCLIGVAVSLPTFATDISDGTNSFVVGISNFGALYDGNTGTGIRRVSDGYDPLQPGTPRDSWGISASGFGGYSDPQFYGDLNLILNGSPVFGSNSAFISTFLNDGSNNLLQVDQTYTFGASNILQIATVVTNVSGSAQAVLFQRNVDWDPPLTFSNFTRSDPFGGFVVDASYYGFEDPDPTSPYAASSGASGGTFGSGDLGAGIKLDLGLLADGGSSMFTFLYGINQEGQSPSDLYSQAAGLGATFLIASYSDEGDFNTASQSAIFGVREIATASATPEPGTLVMLATGLGLVGYGVFRRKA